MTALAVRLDPADIEALREMSRAERGRPILFLPVALGAGIAVYFAATEEPPSWAGLAVLLPALAGAFLARPRPFSALLALIAAAALGFSAAQLAAFRAAPLADLPRTAVILTGTVAVVDILPTARRVTLESARLASDAPPLARSLHVRLRPTDTTHLVPGDSIRIRALLRPPMPPTYPGAWDLQREAYFSGLGGGGTALGPANLTDAATPGSPARWIQRQRDAIAQRVLAAIPGPAGAVAATLLTGESSALPATDRAAFAASGLAHLLAVAGLHIGIVMGIAFTLARMLLATSETSALFWPCKQMAALAALTAGLAYLLLTGGHVPTLRSFAMASLFTLALLFGRRALSLRGLALAAALILLTDPVQLVGPGFQMSFSGVLALITGYELAQPALAWLQGDGRRFRRLATQVAMLALTSFLAGTASAPFAAYHFGRLQLYYVLSNLIAVPLTAFWTMPFGLLALALMPVGAQSLALAPMGWGAATTLWIARETAALPAASLAVPQFPLWGLLLLALAIAWLGIWRTRIRLAALPALAVALASPLLAHPPDLLVSPDAGVIALKTPVGLFAETKGAQRFTLDAYQQFWGEREAIPFPPTGDDADGMIDCSEDACRIAGASTALLLRGEAHPDCVGLAVLISAEPARGRCPDSVALIDRFTVWRDGAQAVWLDAPTPRILSDRAARGTRPWVPPPPAPRLRTDTDLPMAESE